MARLLFRQSYLVAQAAPTEPGHAPPELTTSDEPPELAIPDEPPAAFEPATAVEPVAPPELVYPLAAPEPAEGPLSTVTPPHPKGAPKTTPIPRPMTTTLLMRRSVRSREERGKQGRWPELDGQQTPYGARLYLIG
jgi:hypothetical protein